jgi:hypothetical protein
MTKFATSAPTTPQDRFLPCLYYYYHHHCDDDWVLVSTTTTTMGQFREKLPFTIPFTETIFFQDPKQEGPRSIADSLSFCLSFRSGYV